MWYVNGKLVEEHWEEAGKPVRFKMARNHSLNGMIQCLQQMHIGEVAKFVIDPRALYLKNLRWKAAMNGLGLNVYVPLIFLIKLVNKLS